MSPAQRAVLARRPGRLRVLAVLAVEHPEVLPLPQRVALHDEARAWLLEGGWPAFVLANLDLLQATADELSESPWLS